MTYTINGKEYTLIEIEKKSAELLGFKIEYPLFNEQPYVRFFTKGNIYLSVYEPTTNPVHAWPIIEKCFDELTSVDVNYESRWQDIIDKHNCTKLVAACICFIEINEGGAK
jgi:hypothetical protein